MTTVGENDLFATVRLRLTAGCFLALMCTGIIAAAPGAALPAWRREFEPGSLLSLYFNLVLVGSLIGTTLGSRVGARHPLFFLALASEALGFSLIALSPSFSWIVLAGVFLGFGVGLANFHGNSLTGELWPQRRVTMLSWINAAFGVGAIMTPLLMLALPWRWVMLLFALVALTGAILVWKSPATVRVPAQESRRGSALWLVLVAMLFYVGLETCLATFSGVYVESLGYTAVWGSAILSLYWAGLTIGRLFLAGAVGKNPARALAVLAGCALVILLLNVFPPTTVLVPLVGICFGPVFPIFFSLVQGRFGNKAVGYLFYAGAGGSALIPAAIALVEIQYFPFIMLAFGLGLFTFALRLRTKYA